MTIELYHNECLIAMKQLIEEKRLFDLILTDPPYGTTPAKCDTPVPFEPMWECLKKLRKPTAAILLFPRASLLKRTMFLKPAMTNLNLPAPIL